MSRLSDWHRTLNEDGIGKCSVPMWSGYGGDAGFCDKEAYGERLPTKFHTRWDGYQYADDGKYAGYVPALACPCHGGPESRVFKDGNMWCAVDPDFTNLQESPAGFGETPGLAREALTWAKRNPAFNGRDDINEGKIR